MNNTYTDKNITYTWPDKMPVSSALAGMFTNAEWAPKDPLDPHHPKYYDYNPVGKTPEELLKMKSISALDILWCNPKFAEEGAVPRIKSIPSEINTTTDLFNWIRYYDYTFKYIKLDTHYDYRTKYLTFVVTDGGDITWSGSSSNNKLSYSTDDGATWSTASSDITLSVDIGDKVLWKGTTTPIYEYGIGQFNGDNGVRYDVEGNIMSLLYGDDFEEKTSLNNDDAFYQLFYANEYIVNAENLSLPATTLDDNCYGEMFYGCTNLISAPFELPAKTLAGGCYNYMFKDCTSLTMAPELPATTLAPGCYQGMFEGCTSLTMTPELPATTLTPYCYYDMFNGCTNLSSIKCLATSISATNCTTYWVSDVAASGTFTKAANMSNWTTGINGIPTGWNVTNYENKIDCVKYRIFNKKLDQIGYFGNDGTNSKKLNIKSYNDLSIKSLGHINISAFNNDIKFNKSELKITCGGKRFNINMPWGQIFRSDKDGVTISHITNSVQHSIALHSGGITIKHNNENKELFVDINDYMQSQNIDEYSNPIYPPMPQAYLYTYNGKPVMYHEIGANYEGERHTVTSIKVCFIYEYQHETDKSNTPDPLIRFFHFNKSLTNGKMTYVGTTSNLDNIYKELLTKTFIYKTNSVTQDSEALITSGGVYKEFKKKIINIADYVQTGTKMPKGPGYIYTYRGNVVIPQVYDFINDTTSTYNNRIYFAINNEYLNFSDQTATLQIDFYVFDEINDHYEFVGIHYNLNDAYKQLYTKSFIDKTNSAIQNSEALVTSGCVYNVYTNSVGVRQQNYFTPAQKAQARANIGAASATSELIGEIKMWCSSTIIPDGYLLCNGQTFDTNEYPELYALLGTNTVPDLRDRFIVGAGGSYAVGTTGGEKEVKLTAVQSGLPEHRHSASISGGGTHKHNIDIQTGHDNVSWGERGKDTIFGHDGVGYFQTEEDGEHSHTITIYSVDAAPASEAHENRPPYYALAFIIRASGGTSITN